VFGGYQNNSKKQAIGVQQELFFFVLTVDSVELDVAKDFVRVHQIAL
jgi:hypothetical protein